MGVQTLGKRVSKMFVCRYCARRGSYCEIKRTTRWWLHDNRGETKPWRTKWKPENPDHDSYEIQEIWTCLWPVASSFNVKCLCKCGQNQSTCWGGTMQNKIFLAVFMMWWSWKLYQDHRTLIKSFYYLNDTTHSLNNSSFGSKDRVQTSCFDKRIIFNVLIVTLR